MVAPEQRAELLSTFRTELAEHCQTLERAFLALEKEPEPDEEQRLLNEAFRAAHSLKGAARSVGLADVEALAHNLEDLLGRVRAHELALSPGVFDTLYAAADALSSAADGAAASAEPPAAPRPPVSHPARAQRPPPEPSRHAEPDRAAPPAPAPPVARHRAATAPAGGETLRLQVARLDGLLEQLGELVVPRLQVEAALAALAEQRQRAESWQRDWRKLRPLLRQLEREGVLARWRPLARFLERNEAHLATLGAELAALQAQLTGPTAQLGLLTLALQAETKRLRMLPFGNLAAGFERAVRDLAHALGKEARLVVVGAETELDRHVLDEMKDPLLHLLRNAVDHGIEPPDARQRLGKPSIGSVVLSVSQRGDTATLEIEDDGAGLDLPAIRQAAAARGLLPTAEAARLGDDDARQLIFLPGLSSRPDVSEVSGRGMGLDIVARAVERLGGRIEVTSAPGRGTRFAISLPLTLATTRAVLVEAEGLRYALPTDAVERILPPHPLGSIGGRPTFEYAGSAIPAAPLAALLQAQPAARAPDPPRLLALVRAGAQRVALEIDRVLSEQEVVVKPLGYPLLRLRYVAGATILGSGEVVPILNPADLVRGVLRAPTVAAPRPAEPEQRAIRVLVADDSLTTRSLERYILEAAGYTVELAGDGAEALALLQERPCDVLVSDIDMPELDGIALTTRLRQDPRFRDLPVILVTSLESPQDRERGLQAGADAYIVKSGFDQDLLLRTIRELV